MDPHSFFCESGCFSQCGSGSSCFFNADPDTVKKLRKELTYKEFSVVKKKIAQSRVPIFLINFSLLDPDAHIESRKENEFGPARTRIHRRAVLLT